jgi:hypothetical protein
VFSIVEKLESEVLALGEADGWSHRYLKNICCSSFVVNPLLTPYLPRHFPFFAAAINSTSEANKAGSMHL